MKRGTLLVFSGPMFAGKSTALLEHTRQHDALAPRRSRLILKPAFDTRYTEGTIVTHDMDSLQALALREWPKVDEGTQAIYIDEVQFFEEPFFQGDLIAEVARTLESGIDVVACGLDCDSHGVEFRVTAELGKIADRVVQMCARCTSCGASATQTQRMQPAARFTLGGKELYEPRCLHHWSPG